MKYVFYGCKRVHYDYNININTISYGLVNQKGSFRKLTTAVQHLYVNKCHDVRSCK